MESVENPVKRELLQDLIDRFGTMYMPLKLMGFIRFDITHGQIVQKSVPSILFGLISILIVNLCTYYIFYALTIQIDFLLITEIMIVADFLVFHTLILVNTFLNRNAAAQFLNTSLELDAFLGAKETKFMRDVSSQTYFLLSSCVGVSHVVLLVVLFFTYVVGLAVSVAGAILFICLFFIYYDLSLFLSFFTTLTLRVRYLNVALMKLAKVKLEYLPQQFPFNSFFWNDKYDDMVDFHLRTKTGNFTEAYIVIFKQLRYLHNCYRFTLFLCLTYIIFGTFVTVQGWIIWAKQDVDIVRILAITGWCLLSWSFQFGISQQTDMFQRQINQTNLICTFIQLKPTYTDEIYRLTANIISILEVRDSGFCIYDLFYFDTGLLLRIASSIFVYITMQLQIAFPKNIDVASTLAYNATN